jgi:hypothetical protein
MSKIASGRWLSTLSTVTNKISPAKQMANVKQGSHRAFHYSKSPRQHHMSISPLHGAEAKASVERFRGAAPTSDHSGIKLR